MARRLEVEIVGDASKLTKEYAKANAATTGFGASLDGMKKAAAVAAGAAGIRLLVSAGRSFVSAAQESEKAQFRLKNSLSGVGISYEKHSQEIDKAIQKTSALAAIDDEDLSDAFAKLARNSGSVTTGLKDMNLAADIARGANVSLESATKAVMAAEQGRMTSLRRLGIDIQKTTEAQDAAKVRIREYKEEHKELTPAMEDQIEMWQQTAKATDAASNKYIAIDALQKKFSNSAKEYGQTAAGSQERLGVAFENLQEKIGAKLLPALTGVVVFINKSMPTIEKVVGATFKVIATAIKGVVEGIKALIDTGIKLVKFFKDDLPAAFKATVDWLKKNWPEIATLISGPFAIPVALATDAFGIRTKLVDAFKFVKNWVSENWKAIATLISGPFAIPVALATDAFGIRTKLVDAFKFVKNWAREHWPEIATILSGPFAPIVLLATDAFGIRSKFVGALDTMKKATTEKIGAVVGTIKTVFGGLVDWLRTDLVGSFGGGKGILGALGSIIDGVVDFANKVIDVVNKLPFVDIGKLPKVGQGDVAAGFNAAAAAAARPAVAAGGLHPNMQSMVSQLRSIFGNGWTITSGLRSPEQNAAVGGAPNSDHLTGKAIDIVPAGGWSDAGVALLDQMAAWAAGNPAFRWIGWRGVPGHGPYDHLHLSTYDRGGILSPGTTLARNNTGQNEYILRRDQLGGTTVVVNVGGSVITERDLAATIQRELTRHSRSNATAAASVLGAR